jgi:hypothetical protein
MLIILKYKVGLKTSFLFVLMMTIKKQGANMQILLFNNNNKNDD